MTHMIIDYLLSIGGAGFASKLRQYLKVASGPQKCLGPNFVMANGLLMTFVVHLLLHSLSRRKLPAPMALTR